MTSASSTRKRARLASAVGAMALTLAVPSPAAAAPAPCERAEEYAAQSGAELFHIDRLGGDDGISDVGLAQAKSALVASATVNSAAVTRLLDADRPGTFTEPLIQQAPPTNATPVRRSIGSDEIGPFALGRGVLTSHAQWDPRMACGRSVGEVTRAEATLHDAAIGALLRIPPKTRSRSTTVLDAGGRTVATAGVDVTAFDLLDGAVHVRVVRPPALTARMSTKDGGTVAYQPAILEVSGSGISTRRLTAPGDELELVLDDEVDTRAESSTVEKVAGGVPLALPAIPGLPRIGSHEESAHAVGAGTRLRIGLGKVRQAAAGHAIAAKATAIRVALTQAPADDGSERDSDGYGASRPDRGRVVLDFGVGLLEAAAVAPEPRSGGRGGVQGVAAGGMGAGLPITGSPVVVVAIGGAVLVIAGAAALAFGARRRRFRP